MFFSSLTIIDTFGYKVKNFPSKIPRVAIVYGTSQGLTMGSNCLVKVVKGIEKIQRDFLWNDSTEKRKYCQSQMGSSL